MLEDAWKEEKVLLPVKEHRALRSNCSGVLRNLLRYDSLMATCAPMLLDDNRLRLLGGSTLYDIESHVALQPTDVRGKLEKCCALLERPEALGPLIKLCETAPAAEEHDGLTESARYSLPAWLFAALKGEPPDIRQYAPRMLEPPAVLLRLVLPTPSMATALNGYLLHGLQVRASYARASRLPWTLSD